jgi:hypothetical protein
MSPKKAATSSGGMKTSPMANSCGIGFTANSINLIRIIKIHIHF